MTKELSRLIGMVGGPSADLRTNSAVLSAFIDALWEECPDELKVKRIASEVFYALCRGRQEDPRPIISLIPRQMQNKRELMFEHALNWFIGHSIGSSNFNELLELQKKLNK